MGEYMLFIYERNQDFRQTLYAVVPSRPPPPPVQKKPHQCVCIYIHVYIPIHAHRIPTRHTHTHVPPALRSRCHAFKQLHVSTLFSSPVMTISTGRILVQLRHEEETLCIATRAPWKGACLFVYFSLTLGEAPESKGAAAPRTSLLVPLQAPCSPTALHPLPGTPALGSGGSGQPRTT